LNILKQIPLHTQDAYPTGGINVKHIDAPAKGWHLPDNIPHDVFNKHMDNHYSIGLLTKGKVTVHCDMHEIIVSTNSLFLIKPFQVHAVTLISADAEGYFIGIESFLMPQQCHTLFSELTPQQQFVQIPAQLLQNLLDTIKLLHNANDVTNAYKTSIINGLFMAYVHQVAGLYTTKQISVMQPQNQAAAITKRFNALIAQHSFLQLPSFFAQKLNITTAHLNHCLKAATGFTITHWLQDAMITEAKKLLYYTDDDSKQIAFALGYEDPAYFARLFKKLTGQAPLAFRKKFRE